MPGEDGAIHVRKPNGSVFTTDLDGSMREADTLQCVHCGKHWTVLKGSGRVRGYCARCNGPICGPNCQECVPLEQQLENMEAGRDRYHRPIIVDFPTSLPPPPDLG